MRRLLLALLMFLGVLFICSCSDSKPDQVEITITINHEEGVNCQTYLADYYEVVLFDSMQRKVDTKKTDCSDGISELSLFAEKGEYYFTVSLKDTAGSIKSYGSGIADASQSDVAVTVDMAEFKGAVTFSWNSTDCENYDISIFKFSLLKDGTSVSAVIWGKETDISEYEINCESESFEVVNIDAGKYSAKVDAFRLTDSQNPRITYNIPRFMMVSGQTAIVKMNDSKEITVSDLYLSWEFDSKSISTCSDAGITTVVASLISDDDTLTLAADCDNEFPPFKFYDIPENTYEILLRGMDSSENTLFETSKEIEIKKGAIGKEALKESIYLKEK
ncbi:MAG TPA: hypothetical protein PKG52_04285 [bacterium]|nr:hypothetical protein [bacterium]HPS29976.1 hypothetical protein [bacterium]